MRYFDREGKPLTLMEWANKKYHRDRDRDYYRVAYAKLPGEISVSTVWLGLDHSFREGPPLIFETMVFGGTLEGETWRYSTEEQAIEGHAAALSLVKSQLDLEGVDQVEEVTAAESTETR